MELANWVLDKGDTRVIGMQMITGIAGVPRLGISALSWATNSVTQLVEKANMMVKKTQEEATEEEVKNF